jgi:hypothetical protein
MAKRRKTTKRTRRGKTKTQKAQRSKYSRKKRKISRKRSLKSVGGAGEQDFILKMPKSYQPRGLGPSAAIARGIAPYLTYERPPRDLSNLHADLSETIDYFKSTARDSILRAQEADKIAEQERNRAKQASLKAQELEQSLEQSLAPKPAKTKPAEPKFNESNFNESGQRLDNFGRLDLASLSTTERKAEIKRRRRNTSNKVGLQQSARKQLQRM